MATKNEKDAQDQKDAAKADTPAERPETGYKDVADASVQAEKDAKAPLELDEDGHPVAVTSPAALEVAEEMSYRASAQANGGGPWPPELLAKNFIGVNKLQRPAPVYTSHEDDQS